MKVRIRITLEQLKLITESLLLRDDSEAKALGEELMHFYSFKKREEKAQLSAAARADESYKKTMEIIDALFGGSK